MRLKLLQITAILLPIFSIVGCQNPYQVFGTADVSLVTGEDTLTSALNNHQITSAQVTAILPYLNAARAAKTAWENALASGDTSAISAAAASAEAAISAFLAQVNAAKSATTNPA